MFTEVEKFEKIIAKFYNAEFAVAVDSCTHGIELCLRLLKPQTVSCPKQTYVSIPMTFCKLNMDWKFNDDIWFDYYYIGNTKIIDAAVYWKKDGYVPGSYMALSFQYKKHLNLGRGGMILCDNHDSYSKLKKMSYDGRDPYVPWREQNIDTLGYHYYMTPETAELGISKFDIVKNILPNNYGYTDYPDLSKFKVFNVK
jgi:dTDP-4-amino-4,6-dideoxygalactose transaminase